MARLTLQHVSHRFSGQAALHDVSLDVADGEFMVLLGPSGCGKSTLLRVVAGLVTPDAGVVAIDGRRVNELEPVERDVALVFQSYALYPHMSVRANLAFPLKMAGLQRAAIDERVGRAAGVLGLGPLLERKPGTLSGGQMQRVALGRALVRAPKLFLFDEPLSNLDAQLRGELRAEIARLQRELGVTTLYVTHDQAEAMTLGSRICVLEAGRVRQIGAPLEVYRRPEAAFVARFVGSPPMNLLRGAAADGRFTCGPLALAAPLGHGEVLLGIRPQDVLLGRGTSLPVRFVERLGSETQVHLEAGGQRLLVTCASDRAVGVGSALAVELPAERLHWFDAASGSRLGTG